MEHLIIRGQRLEVVRLTPAVARPNAPTLVFLHEGLGSVSMWRDFPQRVADATGCPALVYSRLGYGRSEPIAQARPVRYMHDEALVTLPALLDAMHVHAPILFGHSDGGSIALIHAGGAARPVRAVIAMAPHVMVEEISVTSIAQAKTAYQTTELPKRLAKYHDHVDSAFCGWNDIWLHPEFRDWNIEEYLPRIASPILAIQGLDDEYGTMEQIDRIGHQARDAELLKLADCGHSPHKDQPDAVIVAVRAFVARVLEDRS